MFVLLTSTSHLATVVRNVDIAIHRINLFPVGNAISFPKIRWIALSKVWTAGNRRLKNAISCYWRFNNL